LKGKGSTLLPIFIQTTNRLKSFESFSLSDVEKEQKISKDQIGSRFVGALILVMYFPPERNFFFSNGAKGL